jgi:hypothetical protein
VSARQAQALAGTLSVPVSQGGHTDFEGWSAFRTDVATRIVASTPRDALGPIAQNVETIQLTTHTFDSHDYRGRLKTIAQNGVRVAKASSRGLSLAERNQLLIEQYHSIRSARFSDDLPHSFVVLQVQVPQASEISVRDSEQII